MLQPHKEERFLFPVYPMICLSGAITVDISQKLFFRIWNLIKTVPHGTHYLDITMFIMVTAIAVTGIFSKFKHFLLFIILLIKLIFRCFTNCSSLQKLSRPS